MQHIISIKNIFKKRQSGFTLHIENFNLLAGDMIALVGSSGCGKSTALDLMSAILRPDYIPPQDEEIYSHFTFNPEGEQIDMLALWQDYSQNKLAKLRHKYIGYVLQTGGLLPFLNGEDNILLACDNAKATKHMQYFTDTLDITHLLTKKPHQMSVGERQRFAIARALVHEPRLILADEPVASLDPLNAKIVLELFTKLAQEQGISIIMVSHSPSMCKDMGFNLISTDLKRQDNQIIAKLNMEAC